MPESAWWQPAELQDIKPVGPDQREPGKMVIRFKIAPAVRGSLSETWLSYFLNPQLGHWQAFGGPPGHESSGSGEYGFYAAVEDDRLAEYRDVIRKCAAEANKKFEEVDVPAADESARRARASLTEEDQRMERARKLLEEK